MTIYQVISHLSHCVLLHYLGKIPREIGIKMRLQVKQRMNVHKSEIKLAKYFTHYQHFLSCDSTILCMCLLAETKDTQKILSYW